MKKVIISIAVFALMMAAFFLPSKDISADPGNLLTNGDFESGSFNPGWSATDHTVVFFDNTYGGVFSYIAELDTHAILVEGNIFYIYPVIYQTVYNITSPDLDFSYDYWNVFSSGVVRVAFHLVDSSTNISKGVLLDTPDNITKWSTREHNIIQWWKEQHPNESMPSFDAVSVIVTLRGDELVRLFVDNFYLGYHRALASVSEEVQEVKWVRPMPMTCWQVWINEDNNFQFIFWYPYKDKNWVRIYDIEGNMVYEVEVSLDDPNIIVDLPDGFYNVKTYHDQELLQEFLVGKP
ncbi:MAG: hypothetical protein MUP02_09465 [Actinobacteria bacterium]|nr:hypothetical protein [Actinomycetota bacterium]